MAKKLRKVGRPAVLQGGQKTSIYLDKSARALVKRYANQKDCTMSRAVLDLVKAGAWAVYKD